MQSITQPKFETLLFETKRCQFVSLASITDPTMRKRNNPYLGSVRKVTLARGVINWQYTSAVKRQRAREDKPTEFKAHPRQWGSRIKHAPLVSHVVGGEGETRLYLELKVEHANTKYFDRNTAVELTEEQLAELRTFFPSRRDSGRQEVDRAIVLRDYRLTNIAELTMAGVRYSVSPAADELQHYFPPASAPPATPGQQHSANGATAFA